MANKKEICERRPVIGGWCIGVFASLQIHHIQYGGLYDSIYCSYVYDKDTPPSYHKLKVHISASNRSYVLFGKSRFYLDEAVMC